MAYKKKNKAPKKSRADIAGEQIEDDILEFWEAIGDSDLDSWDKPWVLNSFAGENAGKFVNDDTRYTYSGGFNQFLIALYTQDKDQDKGPLIINRTEMTKLFEADSFADTPVVENGIKSAGSIFKAPHEKKFDVWKNPNGTIWRPDDGERRRPTKGEIDTNSLEKESFSKKVFSTFPVWSIDDIYEVLPDSVKSKVDDLIELRNVKGYEFNSGDDLEVYIQDRISDVVDRMGINVTERGNEAFYVPVTDDIQLPSKHQFKNPVVLFAVTMHELSHSTMHINGRKPPIGSKVGYATEEIRAETSSVLLTKKLERDLEDVISDRPDIKDMFDDYYRNSMSYNKLWGKDFDFLDHVEVVAEERENNKGILKGIMVDIAKIVDVLNNGEFTPEKRKELQVENFQKRRKPDKSVENSSEPHI